MDKLVSNFAFVALLVMPPLALAAPAPKLETPSTNLTPIVPSAVPERCRPIARLVAVPSLSQALASRVSLATCLADAKLAELAPPVDSELSVMEIDTATAPSFELLDEVAGAGDPVMQIVALRSKGELYTALTVRMLATIPAPPPGAPETAYQLRDNRKLNLTGWTNHWTVRARESFTSILELAKKHPALVSDPVVRNAVRAAEQRVTPSVVSTR